MGTIAAVVFVFGLLAFVTKGGRSDSNAEPGTNKSKQWQFASDSTVSDETIQLSTVDIAKTSISKYILTIKYSTNKDTRAITALTAYSTTSGFISGTEWIPNSIILTSTADGSNLEYTVNGIVEWHLLGLTLYSQSREYKGMVF